MKQLSKALFLLTAFTALPGFTECQWPPPAQQAEPQRQPELKILDITVSQSRARPGDAIHIDWQLQDEELLRYTRVAFLSPVLQGYDSQYTETTDPDVRDIGFTFQGPVTVELLVQDAQGNGDSVTFDIKLDEAYHLEVDVTATHADYPRLQYPTGSLTKHLSFSNFVAFYDPGEDMNHVVDVIAADPVLGRAMSPREPFRAVSWNGREPGFGMTEGSAYPILTPGFLSTEVGSRFAGTAYADAIVFGGAIAYTGDFFPIKSGDEGEIEGARLVRSYETIFVELVYASDAEGRMYLADALLGNLHQGLVLSIFRAEDIALATGCFIGTSGSPENCPALSASYGEAADGTFEVSGSVDAQLGWPVQTIGGDLLWPHVRLEKMRYRMPLVADTDPALLGRVKVNVADMDVWN